MKMQLTGAQKVVIIGVDESRTSENAFHVYAEKMHQPADTVLLVHCLQVHSPHIYNSIFVRPEIEKAEFEKECQRMKHVEKKFKGLLEKYQMKGEYMTVAGSAGATLCKLSKQQGAQQIILGTHNNKGRVARTLLGSVSHYVVRHASCDVVTIKKSDAAAAA